MGRSALGIDVGTRTITVAQVRSSRGAWTVTNFGGVELPEGAVVRGEVVDVDMVSSALTSLLSSAGIRHRAGWLGVGHRHAVLRTVDLPPTDDEGRGSMLRRISDGRLPFAVEDAVLDVHLLDDRPDDPGRRGLLVAVHRRVVSALLEVADRAGVRPLGADLNGFAVLRALVEAGGDDERLTVDVGAGVTTLVVHRGLVPSGVETIETGGDEITRALIASLELDVASAEAAKRATIIGQASGVTDRIVTERVNRVIEDIGRTFDRMRADGVGRGVVDVIVTGGTAQMQGFARRLGTALGLPIRVGNPFDRLATRRTVYGPEELTQLGPSLATAIGLAGGGLD